MTFLATFLATLLDKLLSGCHDDFFGFGSDVALQKRLQRLGATHPSSGGGARYQPANNSASVAAESTRIDQVSICSTEAVMMRCSTWAST